MTHAIDYAPPAVRAAEEMHKTMRDTVRYPEGWKRLGVGHYREEDEDLEPPPPPPPPPVEKRMASTPKCVAIELISLTYGDFMEVATGMGADPQKVWDWAVGLK